MNTQEISKKLVTYLNEGAFNKVYDELFDQENVRHVEPQSEHFSNLVGVAAIKAKDEQMSQHIASVNALNVGEPSVSQNHIALPYKIDFDLKDGTNVNLDELIIYEVKGGKIVLEQFFY